MLTHASLPADPDPSTATPLDAVGLTAVAAEPLNPSPAVTDLAAVATHAVRDLAFLRHTDETAAFGRPAKIHTWGR